MIKKFNCKEGNIMAKRLTEKEKEERAVRKVIAKIKKLEKTHTQEIVEKACYKYKKAMLDRRNAEKEIAGHEKKLAEAKKRLR